MALSYAKKKKKKKKQKTNKDKKKWTITIGFRAYTRTPKNER